MRTNDSPKRHRSCRGKVRHQTQEAARYAAHNSREEYGDLTLVYYPCKYCKGYHVGHPNKAVQKRLGPERLIALIDRAMRS